MNSSASSDPSRAFFAPHALLPTGWARDVLLEWNEGGELVAVTPGVGAPADVASAAGAVIPGMPNLHSHAFQRAFAGLTEYRASDDDSFWSWRERMYRFAAAVSNCAVPGWTATPGTVEVPSLAGKVSLIQLQMSAVMNGLEKLEAASESRRATLSKYAPWTGEHALPVTP